MLNIVQLPLVGISVKSLNSKHLTLIKKLTLTELEATACLGLTGLFALYLAAVAGEEALHLECLLVLGVHLDECAGDSHAQSLALAGEATTVEVHLDVVLSFASEHHQRLLNHILEDG